MTIKELKQSILDNTLSDAPLVLKHDNNRFICLQYAQEIAKKRNLELMHISNLSEMFHEDDFFDEDVSTLFVLDISKLEEYITPEHKNLIVIAEKVPNDLKVDFIEIPKLVNWQIEDFLKMRLPGLTEQEIQWLCQIAKYDIFRLDQECKKIEIFPKNQQEIIFNQLSREGGFIDLNQLAIFDFTDAIMHRNLPVIDEVLKNLRYIDIEATGEVTILLKQFRTLIDTQLSNAWTPSMGCSEKQFYYFKSHPNRSYSQKQIIDIYEFLTGFDAKLKSGEMQFDAENRTNNALAVVYITTKILGM